MKEYKLLDLTCAILMAGIFHAKHFDKAGKPYYDHLERVMNRVGTIEGKMVAILHDIIEDTSVTYDYLVEKFDKNIADKVLILTRKEDESYMTYIRRIKTDPIATKVKLADLEDNMNLNRINNPTKEDYDRVKKYQKAKKELLK